MSICTRAVERWYRYSDVDGDAHEIVMHAPVNIPAEEHQQMTVMVIVNNDEGACPAVGCRRGRRL